MSSHPAGWYPDPAHPAQVRYWDGAQWTPHIAPQPAGETHAGQPSIGQLAAGQDPWTPATGFPGPTTADGVPLATYGSRIGAYLLDTLIVTALSLVAASPFLGAAWEWYQHLLRGALAGTIDASDTVGLRNQALAALWPILAITFVVQLVYHVGFLAWRGATPGKLACHINVRRPDSPGPLPLPTALRRQVIWVVAAAVGYALPVLNWVGSVAQLIDVLWPLWGRRRQALHDLVAGTVVVMTARR